MIEADAVVVGAGQAGLGAAKTIQDRGFSVVVLERGRVGETWLSQRWYSFAMNTPNWLNGLPGRPYDGDDPDGFVTHIDLVAYFNDYVEEFQLDVRENTNVTSVEHSADGTRFAVGAQADGAELRVDAGAVIVASGILQAPRIPALADRLPPRIEQLSTGSYRSPSALPEGAVLVVGGGQSGAQIVEDLLESGRDVYFSISSAPRLPRRYRGRDFMDWMLELGIWDRRTDEVEDPSELSATNPLTSGVGPLGHSLSFQYLASKGATLLGRLEAVDGSIVRTDDRVGEYIVNADEFSAEFQRNVDDFISSNGLDSPQREPDPGDDPVDDVSNIKSLSSLDLDEAGVASVVWSTGFTADFSWLHLPVTDERGLPVHRNGASEVPGLYFIGFPWLSKRKSGVVLGIEEDASHLAGLVEDHMRGA